MTFSRYVVAIRYTDGSGKDKICTAGVISSQIVLTAAHCIPPNLKTMLVIVGDDMHPNRSLAEFGVSAVGFHENFETYKKLYDDYKIRENPYDFAIVKTSAPLPERVRHLQLAARYFSSEQIPTVYVIGYGVTRSEKNGVRESPERLYSAVVKRGREHSDPRFIVLDQKDGTGICVGDSGGPMIVENPDAGLIVMGIASTVYNPDDEKDTCRGESTYINVAFFRDWIARRAFEMMQKLK